MKRVCVLLVLPAAVVAAALLSAKAVPPAAWARPGAEASKVKKELINPEKLYRSPYYTQVVRVQGGRTLFVSGQWSCSPKGELLHKGDLAGQIKQAFTNLKAYLEGAGATPEDVVKINVYLVGSREKDLKALDEGLTACFGKSRHFASTVVAVQGLARDGMLAEVEAVAVVP